MTKTNDNKTVIVDQYQRAVEQGDAEAQQCLDECYGDDICLGFKRVAKLLEELAENIEKNLDAIRSEDNGDDAGIIHTLGMLCSKTMFSIYEQIELFGDDSEKVRNAKAEYQDMGKEYYRRAAELWRIAAEEGDAHAQYSLGLCYADGEGVAEDKAEAVKWFRKAAEQGHEDAIDALKEIESASRQIEE